MNWDFSEMFPCSKAYPQLREIDLIKVSHGQNNDICIHCSYIGLSVTILCCMFQMQHQSCVGFFVLTRCQICYISMSVA